VLFTDVFPSSLIKRLIDTSSRLRRKSLSSWNNITLCANSLVSGSNQDSVALRLNLERDYLLPFL
jgi:hypothetical protein